MRKRDIPKFLKDKVGRFVRVHFNDVGSVDGLCVDTDGTRQAVVFFPAFGNTQKVEWDQITHDKLEPLKMPVF